MFFKKPIITTVVHISTRGPQRTYRPHSSPAVDLLMVVESDGFATGPVIVQVYGFSTAHIFSHH